MAKPGSREKETPFTVVWLVLLLGLLSLAAAFAWWYRRGLRRELRGIRLFFAGSPFSEAYQPSGPGSRAKWEASPRQGPAHAPAAALMLFFWVQ